MNMGFQHGEVAAAILPVQRGNDANADDTLERKHTRLNIKRQKRRWP